LNLAAGEPFHKKTFTDEAVGPFLRRIERPYAGNYKMAVLVAKLPYPLRGLARGVDGIEVKMILPLLCAGVPVSAQPHVNHSVFGKARKKTESLSREDVNGKKHPTAFHSQGGICISLEVNCKSQFERVSSIIRAVCPRAMVEAEAVFGIALVKQCLRVFGGGNCASLSPVFIPRANEAHGHKGREVVLNPKRRSEAPE
jgi:hypothetical protein